MRCLVATFWGRFSRRARCDQGWPFYDGDYLLAFHRIRSALLSDPYDRFLWNAFCRITAGNFSLIRLVEKTVARIARVRLLLVGR